MYVLCSSPGNCLRCSGNLFKIFRLPVMKENCRRYTYVHLFVCMYVCQYIYVCSCVCVRARVYVRIYVCKYVCSFACTYVYNYVFTYAHTHIHVRTYQLLYCSPNAIGKRLKRLGFPSRKGNTIHGENEIKRGIEVNKINSK